MTQQGATVLLVCVLEDICDWRGPVVIALTRAEDAEWVSALSASIPSAVTILPQVAGDLGQRLNALDQTLVAAD